MKHNLCDCSPELDGIDGMLEFFRESFPIAKKTHKCCECGKNIEPGQKYHRFNGKWDGQIETYCTCMACYQIRKDFCPNGYVFSELRDTIWECIGIDYLGIWDDKEDKEGAAHGN